MVNTVFPEACDRFPGRHIFQPMKLILTILILMTSFISSAGEEFKPGKKDKAALLMVHFGTTYLQTRAETIDAINARAVKEFPEMDVFEAYTSRIVIRRLAEKGIYKKTPGEMLLKLASEGYTHVFIQSTNVIDGIEAEALRTEAQMMVPFFKDIRSGHPLLYSLEDCLKVTEILSRRYRACVEGKESAVVMVGHGTHSPATAIYSQIDHMFKATDHPAFHVATIEGYPTFETVASALKAAGARKVTLVPFMFVAGDHVRNDIDTEWRQQLTDMGLNVETSIEGLGQIPEIQEMYMEHIRTGLKSRPLSATEQKAAFLNLP